MISRLSLVLIAVAASTLQLATAHASKSETNSVTQERSSYNFSDSEDNREDNREGKKVFLAAQPVGYAVAPINTFGVDAGLYFNENLILQLEYSSGQDSYAFYDLTERTLIGNAKYFFGNSFYAKAGGGYREIGVKNVFELFGPNVDLGTASSIVAEVAIGNQWQWRTFTLGCDWFGAMIPLAGC